jgi:HAD superfamily hydrolase (TIGR01509 family)
VLRPDLVIFDCDGVLVDSEVIANRVLAEMITAAGLPITGPESQARFQGKLLADVGSDVEAAIGHPLPADFWECFDIDRNAAFARELVAIDGAEAAIAALVAAGVPFCVASQGRRVKTEFTLGHTGLRRHFSDARIFTAYEVARPKPFPDLFLSAAARFDAAPERCVVVEDSVSGMRAGLAAGMRVVAYVAPGLEAPELEGVEVIRAMAELPPLLGLGGG